MTETDSTQGATPTVVLVHGAFADSSGWNGVVERLQRADVPVQAVSNPLRGIAADTAYVASALAQIPGPVLAVGHSYGGAIITNAASRVDNVVGLVYVAGFAPDEGEVLQEVEAGSTDSVLNTVLLTTTYPAADGTTQTEFWIDPEKFPDPFAAALPAEQAQAMALTQRPASALGFTQPNGVPAWKSLPSWAVVATGDRAAGADVVRTMAQRAGAEIVEAEGSHVIMVSKPQVVVDVIMQALSVLSRGEAPTAAGAMS